MSRRKRRSRPVAPAATPQPQEHFRHVEPHSDSPQFASHGTRPRSPLHRYAAALSTRSLFRRLVSHFGLAYDDDTSALAASPLGMFFYNQRFLFFAVGLLYIGSLEVAALISGTSRAQATVGLVFAFWLAAVAITLALHRQFIREVTTHIRRTPVSDFPPAFYFYLLLDSTLVLMLVLLGSWRFHVDLHYFAFLLLANTIVYCACAGAYVAPRRTYAPIPVLLLIFVTALLVATKGMRNDVFAAFRDAGPVLGMSVVAVGAVALVSALRQQEQAVMLAQVDMLGRLEEDLGVAGARRDRAVTPKEHFEQRLRRALRRLTTVETSFGYRAARMWFLDERTGGEAYLLPGPFYGLRSLDADRDAFRVGSEFSKVTEVHVVRGLKSLRFLPDGMTTDAETNSETAAYVPILLHGSVAAALTLYGLPENPGTGRHQRTFLTSVSAIVADTLAQADVLHAAQAQEEIDELFHGESLPAVLPRVATVFARSTRAGACVIALSEDEGEVLRVAAIDGVRMRHDGEVLRSAGLLRAVKGNTIWSASASDMDSPLRTALTKLLRNELTSCVALPFTVSDRPHGVVVLCNAIGRASWFSRNDIALGRRLTHTVGRLFEQFIRMEDIQRSLALAQRGEEKARAAERKWESVARQRQDDIMVITHQLQAPLASMRASLLRLRRKVQQSDALRQLEHIQGLVEDSFALCWGTVATFAKEAGTDTSFDVQEIDAVAELENLAARMQRTNARDDLRFQFDAQPGFPHVLVDRFVFTSVFYSLIHNAMKYADRNSRVDLECGYERSTGTAALKLKSYGEPIHPDEREEIFAMYKRGRTVSGTGRHHAGVGLGLWVARQLLNEVRGTISVELSAATPRLSVFVVTCPIFTSEESVG